MSIPKDRNLVRYKLSPGGQFIVDVGPTPDLATFAGKRARTTAAKMARGAYKSRGGGCLAGASTTGAIHATADRRSILAYAAKGYK
jgi:hypothetical protein